MGKSLDSPLSSCVTLSKILNLFQPLYSHLYIGNNNSLFLRKTGLKRIHVKYLAEYLHIVY